MEPGFQFHKYEIIEVKTSKPRSDSRTESQVLDRQSVRHVDRLEGWPRRIPLVRPMATDSMCGLLQHVKVDPNGRSLGAIEVADVSGFVLSDHGGWSPDELAKLEAFQAQDALFGQASAPMLQAPRLKGKYRYRCPARTCKGHEQGLLDWEFVALQRSLAAYQGDELRRRVKEKFYDQMCGPDRAPVFFVGNQAKRRNVFSVLGVFWPRVTDWQVQELDLGF